MSLIPQKLVELTVWNTARCNLRCKYCFVYALYEDQPNKSMTYDTADELLHFVQHYLRSPGGRIWFFGGEPFVDFDVMKYIVEKSEANGLDIKFGVTTNATLLNEERVKWMARHNFGILCSLDLSEEKHDKFRVYPNGRGSWKEAWRGLQLVRKYLTPVPQIRGTFGPGTIKGLADDIKNLVKLGLTNMAVDAVYEVKWEEEDYEELKREFEKLRKYYEEWYSQGIPVYSMFVRDGIAPKRVGGRRSWISRCGLGQGTVGIDINGDIYPCHRFVASRELKIGDVRRGFLPSRLEWIRRWRSLPPYSEVPERCLDCSFRSACSGGCIAANYDLFGDPHIVPECFCKIKQLCVKYFGDLFDLFKDNRVFRKLYLRRWEVRE